jgi:hypothetical protein
MRPYCPKHCGHFFDRVCVNGDAAYDDDASALLDLVEYPPKVTVKRRVAAILGSDLSQRETGATNPEQDVLQRCDVLSAEIEGNIILGEVAAAPSHRMIDARAVDWGHDTRS